MKVVFSPDANNDLGHIFDHIARDDFDRAGTFILELSQAAFDLDRFPLAWPLVPRYETAGFRRKVYKGYLIFFDVEGDMVTILRILNGARNYEQILFPSENDT